MEEKEGEVRIYGFSCDTVVVDGDVVEDFVCEEGRAIFLSFSDGTVLMIQEDRCLIWRIERIVAGTAEFTKLGPDEKWGGMSERATLKGEISWVR